MRMILQRKKDGWKRKTAFLETKLFCLSRFLQQRFTFFTIRINTSAHSLFSTGVGRIYVNEIQETCIEPSGVCCPKNECRYIHICRERIHHSASDLKYYALFQDAFQCVSVLSIPVLERDYAFLRQRSLLTGLLSNPR
jgi:hypothetical protein